MSTSVTYNWHNITDDLKKACDELEVGELVKEPKLAIQN